MLNPVPRSFVLTLSFLLAALCLLSATSPAQNAKEDDKGFDLQSSAGNVHLGKDASSRDVGLPVYPGARVRKHDENRNTANLSLFTSEFGIKLIVLNFDSDDSPSKIIAFYRDKLKKYGKVLECHDKEQDSKGNHVDADDEGDSESKQLKCEGEQGGDSTELKVGTEDNQHVVAVSPADNGGKGSKFALVYVHTRGKQADI
jgi:hypothetical protein